MKKLLYLLLLLPVAFLTGCNDDNDVPEADLTITVQNAVKGSDNNIYTVAGTEYFGIKSITVRGTNGNNTAISGVIYNLDYRFRFANIVEPFTLDLNPALLPLGNHLLRCNFDILQVDKSIFSAAVDIPFTVVQNLSQVPGYDESTTLLGDITMTYHVRP